jgi:hypothetical protein
MRKSSHTKEQVEAAIEEILRCRSIGEKSLKRIPHWPTRRAEATLANEAEIRKGGVTGRRAGETLARYRRIASRYTLADINQLIRQLRAGRYAMSFSSLLALATLTPETADRRRAEKNLKTRRAMQDLCIREFMGRGDLARAIRQKVGKRRSSARPFKMPFNVNDAKGRLIQAAESFRRLSDAVARPDDKTQEAVQGLSPETRRQVLAEKTARGKTGSLLSQMPRGQQKLLAGACETMEKLARELAKG